MERTIRVTVRDLIARQTCRTVYVCGNSEYVLEFEFDDEWKDLNTKTARFKWNGQPYDVVFDGNRCPVPVISDAFSFTVGVFAGNLRTTTDAYISSKKGALCGGGLPHDPPPDVYAQIMEKLNNAGGVTPEQIEAAVKEYLDENPVEGITQEELEQEVTKQLQAAKDSGEFDGADGKDGKDGYTPVKGVDYFDGKDGQDGAPGEKGADGYTPVKGTDYWTAADQQQIISDVLAQMPESGGGAGGGGTWALIINQRIAEDCVSTDFYAGDNGETLTEYDDIIIFIELCANAGDYTTGVKASFRKDKTAWQGGYGLPIKGQKLSEFTGRQIHASRFQKTSVGVIPIVELNQVNSLTIAQSLYVSWAASYGGHIYFDTPFTVGGPDALDYETISTAAEFEAIRIGGYQAVMGAGSVIKVWGHKA